METDEKGATPPDEEQKNRILLVLTVALFLLIFMDYQARRHYSSLKNSTFTPREAAEENSLSALPGKEKLKREGNPKRGGIIERAIEEAEEAEEMARQAQEKAAAPLSESLSVEASSVEPIRASTDTILGKAEELVSGINAAVKSQIEKEATNARKKLSREELDKLLTSPLDASSLENRPSEPADSIAHHSDQYYLYYFYFRNGRSQLVRVTRPASGSRLRLTTVLRNLQKGPLPAERNLLNNFDSHITVHNLYVDGNRVVIDLDEDIGRLGRHVVKDRIDQLVYTLTQFPTLQEVSILVNGKRKLLLGESHYRLPDRLSRSKRKVSDWR